MSGSLNDARELVLELHSDEEQFRTFMNHAPFLAFIKDVEGHFLFYNSRMAEQFGITRDQWLGKTDFEIWPEAIAQRMHSNDQDVISSGLPAERIEETTDPDGSVTTWKVHKFSWKNRRGEILLGGIGTDLSQEMGRERALEEANLQLAQLATTDDLTGLANRRVLDERIEYEFRAARRHRTKLSVVLLDLDNFKRRNDVYGHASGDDALRRMGRLIQLTLRFTDTAARYGGEEFVVLLPGTDQDGARIFAERLRDTMRNEAWPYEVVTASFGMAEMTASVSSGYRLIALADRAMYAAKRAGKDRAIDITQVPPRMRRRSK